MTPPEPPRTGHGAGILLMLVAILMFSLNDVLAKSLVATYSVGQIVLMRSVAALLLILPFLWPHLPKLRHVPRRGLQGLRMLCGTLELAAFYWVVGHMPLAEAMTFWMAAPIAVVAVSALALGERVDRTRWALVLAGFGGVLLALGPSEATPPLPAAVAVGGVLLYAVFLASTRVLRGTPDMLLVGFQTTGALLLGALMAPFGWVTPDPADAALLLLLGMIAVCGHICVTRSLRLAPASVVVPWQYTMILWGALFGWVFFGEVPGWGVVLGAAIIAAAGLALFRLDRRRRGG